MKLARLSLILFIFFLIQYIAFGQKMAVEGNQWNRLTFGTFSPGENTTLFRVNGETIVDDVAYFQIESTSDTTDTNWSKTNDLIREDDSGKVFYKNGGQDEILLYDFGILVGDTLFANNYGCSVLLQSIDTVFLSNGDARNKFNFVLSEYPDYIQYTWIEGIGSNYGPFFNKYCYLDINTSLLCFYNDGELLYSGDSDVCYRYVTSIENTLPKDIQIYPNPMSESLFIKHGITQLESIKIVDLYGNEVLSRKYLNESYDVSSLSAGTYFILLQDVNGISYSDKLIKMDF